MTQNFLVKSDSTVT